MLTYLATPYSHPDPAVREQRFLQVTEVAARLMRDGHFVYSPISHSHPMTHHGLPGDWEYWSELDRIMIGFSQRLIVLTLDGWKQSIGVLAEIGMAEKCGIEIEYMEFKKELTTCHERS